jgi:hypothetical protein
MLAGQRELDSIKAAQKQLRVVLAVEVLGV